MAKVGILEFSIKSRWKEKYQLHYTSKMKFQVRGIDEEFFNLTDTKSYGYETEAELKAAIWDAIPKYHKLKSTQRLVIAYRASSSPALKLIEKSRSSFHGRLEGVSKRVETMPNGSPYASIGIDYKILMEVYDGTVNAYHTVDDAFKVSCSNPVHPVMLTNFTYIDYSDESWMFFENLKTGMQKMLQQMSVFFDLNADDAKRLIESNIKLLK